MRTVGKFVLIEKDPDEEKTAGGIILPTSKKKNRGTVLKIGPSTEFVKEGQRVLYHPYNMTDIEVDGKKCGIIHEDGLVAIL